MAKGTTNKFDIQTAILEKRFAMLKGKAFISTRVNHMNLLFSLVITVKY